MIATRCQGRACTFSIIFKAECPIGARNINSAFKVDFSDQGLQTGPASRLGVPQDLMHHFPHFFSNCSYLFCRSSTLPRGPSYHNPGRRRCLGGALFLNRNENLEALPCAWQKKEGWCFGWLWGSGLGLWTFLLCDR